MGGDGVMGGDEVGEPKLALVLVELDSILALATSFLRDSSKPSHSVSLSTKWDTANHIWAGLLGWDVTLPLPQPLPAVCSQSCEASAGDARMLRTEDKQPVARDRDMWRSQT